VTALELMTLAEQNGLFGFVFAATVSPPAVGFGKLLTRHVNAPIANAHCQRKPEAVYGWRKPWGLRTSFAG
jgi:hypothetical protein